MVAAFLMVVVAFDLGCPYWLAFAIATRDARSSRSSPAGLLPLRNPQPIALCLSRRSGARSSFPQRGSRSKLAPHRMCCPAGSTRLVILSAGLSRQPVSAHHRRHPLGLVAFSILAVQRTLLVKKLRRPAMTIKWRAARQFSVAAMIMITSSIAAVLCGNRRHSGGAGVFVLIQWLDDRAESLQRRRSSRFGDVAARSSSGFRARDHRNLRRRLSFPCLSRLLRLPRAVLFLSSRYAQDASAERVAERRHERAICHAAISPPPCGGGVRVGGRAANDKLEMNLSNSSPLS